MPFGADKEPTLDLNPGLLVQRRSPAGNLDHRHNVHDTMRSQQIKSVKKKEDEKDWILRDGMLRPVVPRLG